MKKTVKKRNLLLIVFIAIALITGGVLLYVFNPFAEKKQIASPDEISMDEVETTPTDTAITDYFYIDISQLASNESKKSGKMSTPEEEEFEPEIHRMDPHNNIAKVIIGNLFEVVRPARTPFIISCKNLYKTFDFQWNTNAETVEVVLKDKKGRIILEKEIAQTGLQLKYEDYYKYLEIFWELKATFPDGTIEEKNGVLQLMVDE